MRVGVYVDGFNLYYGARLVMGGRGIPGWRWLDLRVLSEVNVATHLLVDAFNDRIDGAVVISNDSDLALPIRHVRDRIPVGLVNPPSITWRVP
jgi:hypothetical protein